MYMYLRLFVSICHTLFRELVRGLNEHTLVYILHQYTHNCCKEKRLQKILDSAARTLVFVNVLSERCQC